VTGSRPLERATGSVSQLLLVAAVLRVAGLLSEGHGGDMTAFITWAEDAAAHGLGGYYAAGGDSNYPPMLYLLYPLGLAFDGGELAFAIRLLSIPFDLALGWVLYLVVASATGRARDGWLAAAFYLLNPAVLMSGPIWGQVDGMGALPMVAAVVAAARSRVVLAGALAVIAGLIKPQFGIAGLVLAGLALFWLRSPEGIRRAALMALAGLVAFVVVLAPLGLSPIGYLEVMRDTFTRYPYISQFGFNPWGMVFGFGDDDAAWSLLGTVLAGAGIAASLWLLRGRRDLVGLLGVSVLIGLVIYFLPTRVHERYLFGAIAFLAPLAAMERRLVWPFAALSAAAFVTVAYVAVTSPYRILPGPEWPDFPDWAISVMSAATTAIGAWTAYSVVGLFRRDARPAWQASSASDSTPVDGGPAPPEAPSARSG
jgi:hypothetical protein